MNQLVLLIHNEMFMNNYFEAFFELMYVLMNKKVADIMTETKINGSNSNVSIVNMNIEAKNSLVNKIMRKRILCRMLWLSFVQPNIVS